MLTYAKLQLFHFHHLEIVHTPSLPLSVSVPVSGGITYVLLNDAAPKFRVLFQLPSKVAFALVLCLLNLIAS